VITETKFESLANNAKEEASEKIDAEKQKTQVIQE